MTFVSVIVTTFDDGQYLPGCLDSVFAQTALPGQVILVDDGSATPDALAGIEAALSAHPGVELLRQHNQGPSAARNHGLEAATGDFVAFLDADDRWAPDNLSKRLALFGDDDRIVAAYSGFVAQEPDSYSRRSAFRVYRGELEPRLIGAPGGVPGGLPLYLLRRSALAEAGGLDPALVIMEDFDLLLRLARSGGRFAGTNDPLYLRTLRPGSLTRASAERRYHGTMQFLRKAAEQGYFTRGELARRRAFALAARIRQRLRLRSSTSE